MQCSKDVQFEPQIIQMMHFTFLGKKNTETKIQKSYGSGHYNTLKIFNSLHK